jgi:hypothetical protein
MFYISTRSHAPLVACLLSGRFRYFLFERLS